MKLRILTSMLAVAMTGLTGCVNPDGSPNNTGSGALMGGAVGALSGAAIGGCRHGGPDALIGAAVGAAVGGIVGLMADREQEARLKAYAPQTYVRVEQGKPLTVADVKALAKAGISEDIIIAQIRNTRTVYRLTAADIIGLRDSGVPDRVVNYMINTPTTTGVVASTFP